MSSSRKRKPPKAPAHVAGVRHMTGAAPVVAHAGRTWRLGFNTQDAKGRLEELFRAHVVRDAIATKRAIGGAEGEEYYDRATARLERGHYATFAPGWVELLNSPVGAVLYLQSLLAAAHPEATREDATRLLVDEPDQTRAAIEAVSPDFFTAVATQLGAGEAAAAAFGETVAAQIRRPTAGPGTAGTS